ncbi:MAG: hypothetical protein KAX49_15715, partial [Halanaerobiales bacterium]|nr:hypothetical protein [Halanaerobiales bacterium]
MEKKITLETPKTIWSKPVELKTDFLKGLGNVVKDMLLKNYTDVPADALEVISGVELKDDLEGMGWILISRAFIDAILNFWTVKSSL